MKKLQDLKKDPGNEIINLKRNSNRQNPEFLNMRGHSPSAQRANNLALPVESEASLSNRNILYKQKTPIKAVQDLYGDKPPHYFYIRGKKFTPPRYLGSLIRIGFLGFLIMVLFNAVNVYYRGKELTKNISASAYKGYSLLIDAGKNATKIEFGNAAETFEQALENFSEAESKLWFISTDKSAYSNSNNLAHTVSALLLGGKHFTEAGTKFLDALEEFNKMPLYFVSKNTANSTSTSPIPSLTDTLRTGLEKVDLAIKEVNLANEKISSINENSLPSEIKTRVSFAKKQVQQISGILKSTQENFPAFLKLLGDPYPHRYLIILQNNNEIRPTGGFIGSYVILDIDKGKLGELVTHDVYSLDNPYKGFIEPPEDLKDFAPNWRFRDSNYSPDFPTSASKAKWFLEKEGGPHVDTVIAINQGLLRDLLEITGPVQVGNFGKLESENYNLLLSYIIEGKIWGREDPKHILKVFIPAFKEAILKEENISRVASKLYKAVQQKHIMLYSSDAEIESLFETLGVSGRVYENKDDEDYLSVIHTSIGGTKSDQFIEETISHNTVIDKNGNLNDELTIKRKHGWIDQIYFQWKKTLQKYGFNDMPDQLIDILGRGQNKVYTKIYVPAGSILVESNGSDVATKYDRDLKKTYFFTTMLVKAGESQTLKIKYRIPFTLDLRENPGIYKLFVEKQPGSRGSIFNKTLQTDQSVKNLEIYPPESRTDSENNIIYATNLVYDRYFSGIFSH